MESEFTYKFEGQLFESKLALSQDGKNLAVVEVRDSGLWVNHGCGCSLNLNSFYLTTIIGSDLEALFIDNENILLKVNARDSDGLNLFKYNLASNSVVSLFNYRQPHFN
jgi:hypothetical protein